MRLEASANPQPNLKLAAALVKGWDNFEVTFPDPSLDNRDARRTIVDLSMRIWLNNGLHNLTLSLAHTDNDAKGSNFAHDGFGGRLRFETAMLRPVWLAAEFSYDDQDYGGFVSGFIPPPGRTSEKVSRELLQALLPLARHWSADLFYIHEQYDSNQPQFEGDTNVWGAGLSYRF